MLEPLGQQLAAIGVRAEGCLRLSKRTMREEVKPRMGVAEALDRYEDFAKEAFLTAQHAATAQASYVQAMSILDTLATRMVGADEQAVASSVCTGCN